MNFILSCVIAHLPASTEKWIGSKTGMEKDQFVQVWANSKQFLSDANSGAGFENILHIFATFPYKFWSII